MGLRLNQSRGSTCGPRLIFGIIDLVSHMRNDRKTDKMSSEFASRLLRLDPKQKARAIVLLRVESDWKPPESGGSQSRREHTIEVMQEAERLLPHIDTILKRHGGQRLASKPNVLGSIPVEATADGIRALAQCKHVKAILEDQPISLIP